MSQPLLRPQRSHRLVQPDTSSRSRRPDAQPFRRWRAGVNFEHTFVAVFGRQLERVTSAAFVGDERYLPNVAQFKVDGGFAYVAGKVTTFTGASAAGTYPSAVKLP